MPRSLPVQNYEQQLYPWLMRQEYKALGWHRDKEVRDTGPYVNGDYYGTHPAVRIFYSPGVMKWLENDRQGDIPDGAMIIKEMYLPPAVIYQELEQDPKYQKSPKQYEKDLGELISGWTVMVRDQQGSKDGWFWTGPNAPKQGQSIAEATKAQLDDYSHPLYSSFGDMCLRCHASAESGFTFSALSNIKGMEPNQEPIRFLVDPSWRNPAKLTDDDYYPLTKLKGNAFAENLFGLTPWQRPWASRPPEEKASEYFASNPVDLAPMLLSHMRDLTEDSPLPEESLSSANNAITSQFKMAGITSPRAFPSQWADHVVAGPDGAQAFITSDNCLGCHGGLGGNPYGLVMFAQTGPAYGEGYNLSEYGEWRWSPMGLAGRDPIFHAQLESEMAYLEMDAKRMPSPLKGTLVENKTAVRNTCLSCHGAMGQRQLTIDAEKDRTLNPDFQVDFFYLSTKLNLKEKEPENYRYHEYGELAREGISCLVCHRIKGPSHQQVENWQPEYRDWVTRKADKSLAYMLFHNTTGRFIRGENEILYGPFDDVATKPMAHSLGLTPEGQPYTRDSQMCGTCHTINLPNIGATEDTFPILTAAETNPALKVYPHSIEQATFLEWQNSIFAANPDKKKTEFASCQDCHMPNAFQNFEGSVNIEPLRSQIASIQDVNYPESEHRLPNSDITVPLRENYRRHELVGLNVFMVEMFDQFPEILGVDKTDPMTSATNGADLAVENMLLQAKMKTADLKVDVLERNGNTLRARVTIRNKAGHRFPSGVAFRRAFIEFTVLDGETSIWSSGSTNQAGVIIGGDGKPLKTEFLSSPDDYQPHYQTITSQDQVQIYEELTQNAQYEFTTSFIHRVHHIKDNRLLPKGWRKSEHFKNQGELMVEFMEATDPLGVGDDPDYQDQGKRFPGQDAVIYEVTLPEKYSSSALNVRARLYYQAIPPYWIKQRLDAAPNGEATQRLLHLITHLDLNNTPMESWKLKIQEASLNLP
ncbi:hypothetical protein GCM10007877_31420 [Marinibactrum halimedae]|uniref:Cytochrome c domain-containing protein n=1 Tax=Marinibactrum halimedae TaxID=1444977 RepID=A0AA37WNB9_9GAMM|nr:hypothetical protein GCM10007877_31420 [Marinibactrum halimedae]